MAGSAEKAPQLLEKTLSPSGHEARLYFGDRFAGAPEAAWINATAAHALDFDDVGLQGHPSAVLVPAILAEASRRNVTGSDIIDAYLVGYEVWAELVLREHGQHHVKGWHPTSLFGCVGAAAACARLMGLDASHASTALALAASQSAGLVASFGSMAKPLQVGRAAYAGVIATRLAAAGMTATADALEHPQGLLLAASPHGDVDLKRPVQSGSAWHILSHGLEFKRYPSCLSTSRGLDGIRDLMARHAISADEVAGVTVTMSRRNATILRHHQPSTALEAKFSMEFAAAAALVTGSLSLTELTDDFVQRSDIQALMRKITVEPVDEEDTATGYAPSDCVSVRLTSGQTLETRVSEMPGTERQIGMGTSFEKFRTCLKAGGFQSPAEEFHAALMRLDQPLPARELIGRWL